MRGQRPAPPPSAPALLFLSLRCFRCGRRRHQQRFAAACSGRHRIWVCLCVACARARKPDGASLFVRVQPVTCVTLLAGAADDGQAATMQRRRRWWCIHTTWARVTWQMHAGCAADGGFTPGTLVAWQAASCSCMCAGVWACVRVDACAMTDCEQRPVRQRATCCHRNIAPCVCRCGELIDS